MFTMSVALWMTYLICLITDRTGILAVSPGEANLRFYNGLDVPCSLRFPEIYKHSVEVYKDSSVKLYHIHISGDEETFDINVKCAGLEKAIFKSVLKKGKNSIVLISMHDQGLAVETFTDAPDEVESNIPIVKIFGAEISDRITWMDKNGIKFNILPNMAYIAGVAIPNNDPRTLKIDPQVITLWKNDNKVLSAALKTGGVYHVLISEGNKALAVVVRDPNTVNAFWYFFILVLELVGKYFTEIGYDMYLYIASPYILRAHVFVVTVVTANNLDTVLNNIYPITSMQQRFLYTASGMTFVTCVLVFITKKINRLFVSSE